MPNGQGWICKGSEENRHEAAPLPDYVTECPICGLSRQSPTEPTTKNTAPKAKSEKLQDQSIEKDDKKIEDSLDSFHKAFQSLIAIILLFSENIWQSFVGIILAVLFFIRWDKIKNLFITLWTKGKNLKSNRCLNRLILFFFVIFISFIGKVIKDRIDDPCKTLFSTTCTTEDLINSFYKGNQIEGFYTFLRRKNQPELKTQVLYHDIRQKNLFQNCSKSEESEATFNKFWSLAVSPPNGNNANYYWASGVARKREGDSSTDENMAVVWDEFGKIYAQGQIENKATIHSLAFSSQSCLVTGQHNGSIGTWAFGKNPNRIDTINVSSFTNQEITHISSDGNSRVLITDKGRNAKIVSIDNSNCSIDKTETIPEEFANKILVADFLPSDSQWIVTVLTNGTLNFWKLNSDKPVTVTTQINSEILSNTSQAWLSFSQDNEYLLVGYEYKNSYFLQAYKINFNNSLPEFQLVRLEEKNDDDTNRVNIGENVILDIALTKLTNSDEDDRLVALVGGQNGLFKKITISVDKTNPLRTNKYYESKMISPYQDRLISGIELNPKDSSQLVITSRSSDQEPVSSDQEPVPPILWDLNGSSNEYIHEELTPYGVTKVLTRNANTIVFLSLSEDGQIRRYDSTLTSKSELRDPSLNIYHYIGFGITDDDQQDVVTINTGKQLQIWEPDEEESRVKSSINIDAMLTISHNSKINDMVFYPDSNKILALSVDNQIQIIDLSERKLVEDLSPQSVSSIRNLRFSRDGKYIGAIVKSNSSKRDELVIWDLNQLFEKKTSSPLFKFENQDQKDQYISFSFDPTDDNDSTIIALTQDNKIQVLSLENNSIKLKFALSLPDLVDLNRKDYLNQKTWKQVLFSKKNQYLILVGEEPGNIEDRDIKGIIISIDWNKTKSKNSREKVATLTHIFEGNWNEIADIQSYHNKSRDNDEDILLFSDKHKHLIRLDLLEHNTLINNGIEWSKDYKSNRDGICTAE